MAGRSHIYDNVGLAQAEAHYDDTNVPIDERDAASDGDREMDVLRADPATASSAPAQATVQQMTQDAAQAVQQDAHNIQIVANAQHQVADFDDDTIAVGGDAKGAGPMGGQPKAITRARLACVSMIAGLLGIVVGGGITALSLKMTGYLESKGAGGANDPSTIELMAWFALPNDTVFKFIFEQATRPKAEWSVATWNYVMSFLSVLFTRSLKPADAADYAKLLATDALLDADIVAVVKSQTGKTQNSFDAKAIFDLSASYLTQARKLADPALFGRVERGIRIDYLARIYGKAVIALNT